MPRVTCVSTVLLCLLAATALHAQQPPSSTVTTVPRLVRVTSAFVPANGLPVAPVETVTLAIYAEETGSTPLWQETQHVAVDAAGRYTVLLGATLPDGLPMDLFASGEARWLGRRFERSGEGEPARGLLASVPYALKASDADTLGGRPVERTARGCDERGIPTYGILPLPMTEDDELRMHGDNERVPLAALGWAAEYLYRVVLTVATEGTDTK
jgi:hypothetical protein